MTFKKRILYTAISGLMWALLWRADASAGNNGLLELPSTPPAAPSARPALPAPQQAPLPMSPPTGQNAVHATMPLPAPPASGASGPSTAMRGNLPTDPSAIPVNAASEAAKASQDVGARSPDVVLDPIHLESTSLMFSKSDMNVISQALSVYDSGHYAKAETSGTKEDLSSLLDSLKQDAAGTPKEAPAALPNIYLESIVYYSPSHWSVWINGKKLLASNNAPKAEFYISRLSREEVELVWTPLTLLDTASHWNQLTENGAHPLINITVDEHKNAIILRLHPNQTFLPRSLTIHEGLVKPPSATSVASIPPPPSQPADATQAQMFKKFSHTNLSAGSPQ